MVVISSPPKYITCEFELNFKYSCCWISCFKYHQNIFIWDWCRYISCCTLNVFNRRGAKICWTNETDFCFPESFLLTAQMWDPPPFQSIIKSFTTTKPFTHSHANPPTRTLIWIHFFWLQPGMTGTSTDTPVETLQAAARRSFYLKSVCFISPLLFTASVVFIASRHGQIGSYQTRCPRVPQKDQIPADSLANHCQETL